MRCNNVAGDGRWGRHWVAGNGQLCSIFFVGKLREGTWADEVWSGVDSGLFLNDLWIGWGRVSMQAGGLDGSVARIHRVGLEREFLGFKFVKRELDWVACCGLRLRWFWVRVPT
jgi:hypothetical protein